MSTATQSRPAFEKPPQTHEKHVSYLVHPVDVRARGLALAIDTFIIGTIGGSQIFWFHNSLVLQAVLFISIYLAYFIVMEAVWGATLGKMSVGLKVVKTDGLPITWKDACIRNLLRLVDGLLFYLVGVLFIRSAPSQQRYGDRIAHTVVILIRPHKSRPVKSVDEGDDEELA